MKKIFGRLARIQQFSRDVLWETQIDYIYVQFRHFLGELRFIQIIGKEFTKILHKLNQYLMIWIEG